MSQISAEAGMPPIPPQGQAADTEGTPEYVSERELTQLVDLLEDPTQAEELLKEEGHDHVFRGAVMAAALGVERTRAHRDALTINMMRTLGGGEGLTPGSQVIDAFRDMIATETDMFERKPDPDSLANELIARSKSAIEDTVSRLDDPGTSSERAVRVAVLCYASTSAPQVGVNAGALDHALKAARQT